MRILLIARVVILALGLLAAPLAAVGAELAVARGYRAETVVSGLAYVVNAMEPFRGALLVHAPTDVEGSRYP